MITIGSVSRETASKRFPFLSEKYSGRRKDIKAFTHTYPEFVFWIYPNGALLDAKDAHKKNPPKDYEYILKDEPDYGGFLRGRVARQFEDQLIVIYCRPETLENQKNKIDQFLTGIRAVPIPLQADAIVVSDNGDLYGTIADLEDRFYAL